MLCGVLVPGGRRAVNILPVNIELPGSGVLCAKQYELVPHPSQGVLGHVVSGKINDAHCVTAQSAGEHPTVPQHALHAALPNASQ